MVEDLGKLLLRLNVGGLLLCRGIYFLLNGLDPIKKVVATYNVPEAVAYGVYVGELVAPLLIIFGLFTRIGGALVTINMIAAVVLTHCVEAALLRPDNGGFTLELEAFFLIGGLCVALLGPGRISIEALWRGKDAAN